MSATQFKIERKAAPIHDREQPWVKVYPNGKTSVILIFSTEAVRQHEFKPDDPIELYFDRVRNRVGLRRNRRKKDLPRLAQHGGKYSVLKLPISAFAQENFGALPLPYRADLVEGKMRRDGESLLSFEIVMPPSRKKKVGKPVVPVTPE